jgi:predicted metalloprotease with PDZ domain
MSRQAAFIDAAASIDPTNSANTYLSYYDQGAGIALALDLQLRQRHSTTLDKYMQAMWQQFGKKQQNFAPAAPYTLRDLQRVLGEVSKDTAFAGSFFRQYVHGREQPRFSEHLLAAGLAVLPNQSVGPALARQVAFDKEGRCLVANYTRIGSGLYQAGLDRGDQLLVLDGKELRNPNDLEAVLRKHAPTDVVFVKVRTRGGEEKTVQLLLTEDPVVQLKPVEKVDKMVYSPSQKALREAWLASQAGN